MVRGLLALGLPGILLLALSGCQKSTATAVAPSAPMVVPVSQPVQREVTDFVEFTGRVNAVQTVDVRARVTGYLTKMPFKEGAEVKAGDLLYEIDPRPYQAQVDVSRASLNLYKSQYKVAKAVYERDKGINSRVSNSVAQQQVEQDFAAVEESDSRVKWAEKTLESTELNLEFTRVTAPIDGLVSRYYMTLGNLVNQDQTLLTTVVSLDPVHVYFDMDEPTLLRIRNAINEGKIERGKNGFTLPLLMSLQGEKGFPHTGTVNFFDNQVAPTTGSISVRGVFPNPEPKGGGVRLLSPGMFVRIRLPIGKPHESLLVVDRAISSDQGMKFVYVLNGKKKVKYRRVVTGAQQGDGLRVVEERGYGLRVLSSVKDVKDIPAEGKKLVVVADVDRVLHFRIFDENSSAVVDTDEKKLLESVRQDEKARKAQVEQMDDLRKQLEKLGPAHELTRSEKTGIIDDVTELVDFTLDGLEPDHWVVTSGLLQVRPNMKVDAEREPMPTLLGRTTQRGPSSASKKAGRSEGRRP